MGILGTHKDECDYDDDEAYDAHLDERRWIHRQIEAKGYEERCGRCSCGEPIYEYSGRSCMCGDD